MTLTAPDDYQPFRTGFLADPWKAYARLRGAGPVAWHPVLKTWFVSGRAEAEAVLHDEAFHSYGPGESIAALSARSGKTFPRLLKVLDALPFFHEPPAHTLLRRAAVAAFANRSIAAYAPRIRALADRLLQPARHDGGFDAVGEFADLLPPLFIGELMGIPETELHDLRRSNQVLRGMNRLVRLAEYAKLDGSAQEGIAYFERVVTARRLSPGDDAVSRMMAAEHEGRRLSDAEVANLCLALYLVSVETTSTLIGSSIRTLTDAPGQRELLRSQPGLMKQAVDELLRFESPVQTMSRIASGALELGGQQIEPGAKLVVVLGAANRDPQAWAEPDALDIRREGPVHLAFGDGRHHCVGAGLARLEAQVALGAWLELPECRRRNAQDQWWELDWLRRLREFPVEFH